MCEQDIELAELMIANFFRGPPLALFQLKKQ